MYECPSADKQVDLAKSLVAWPDGIGAAPWEYAIYGCYGMNRRICAGWSDGHGGQSHHNLYRTKRPDKLYLMADTWARGFDHFNDEHDFWYALRHATLRDSLNLTFMDGHTERFQEKEIPTADLFVAGSLPWWDGEDVVYGR